MRRSRPTVPFKPVMGDVVGISPAVSSARPLKTPLNSLYPRSHARPQAVRNIREVRGFGAEARELSRFQGASQGATATSVKIGAAAGRLEALNRAAIYFR